MPAPHFLAGLLLLLSIFVTLARVYTTPPASDPAVECGFSPQALAERASGAVNLTLWAVAPAQACWRAYGPVLAARNIVQPQVQVRVTAFETLSSVYRRQLLEAMQQRTAPDLAVVSIGELTNWARRGYLVPFADCRARHSTFETVDERLWATARWNHELWGVPVEARMELLYFNKRALHQLGWSEQQIAELPQQIAQGTFTLEDLLATAAQAVAANVVEPGYAIWPSAEKLNFFQMVYTGYADALYHVAENKLMFNRTALTQTFALQRQLVAQKLMSTTFTSPRKESWLDTNLWRDTVIQGRVLFWTGSNSDWSEWENRYADTLGGAAYLERAIGYARFPAVTPGTPGHVLWLHTGYYVMLTAQATGHTQQAAACAVLAQTLTPAINAKHVIKGAYLGVLTSPAARAAYSAKPFNAATMAMWPHAKANYNRYMALFDWFQVDTVYETTLLDALSAVTLGQVEPATAAATVLERLQTLLGDRLLVE